jgi:hypothetical protein
MPWHAADVPGAREIAVLVACERLVQRWPDAARIAFRKAVLADVESFSSGVWDPIAPQIKAEMYYARWQLGLPWPPGPDELRVVTAEVAYDRDEVSALAARIRAVGLPLALASR